MYYNKKIIFHRISKLDFLGKNYSINNTTTFEIEITYRQSDLIDKMSNQDIYQSVIVGLKKIKFLDSAKKINFYDIKKFSHAYAIYDLNHRSNVDKLISFYKKEGIYLNGRFGTYEYLNSDQVIKQSKNLSELINR